jgi:hypothetical protein
MGGLEGGDVMANCWKFIVTGQSGFPLDMLRYDACYPTSQASVEELSASLETVERVERLKSGKMFTVHLASRVGSPEVARWSSFSWRVNDVKKERVS